MDYHLPACITLSTPIGAHDPKVFLNALQDVFEALRPWVTLQIDVHRNTFWEESAEFY